ncbi:TetR/AcrR family transcriptional regulator [Neobacillus sp. LXY-1]|uniref:TetR/AcrR family transcriptional regulator n=1 Tax=Neobacillus sp. LXY-1 TaxID=3379133 RepID=UPI003EDFBA3F
MRDFNADQRVIRTKQSIKDALMELIEEKGFESITVKDITNRAKINRGTFYIHYQDKFDLMTKCQEEFMLEMSTIAKLNFPSVVEELGHNPTGTRPLAMITLIIEFINKNRKFMKAMLGPKGDLSFATNLKNFMWNTLFHKEHLIKKENLLVPEEYLVSYIASAHIGVIQQWLVKEGKETPEEIARILSTITVNGPFFAAGLKK